MEETDLAEGCIDPGGSRAVGVDVPKTKRHLVLDGPGKEHGVRILKDQPHVTREIAHRGGCSVEAIDEDTPSRGPEQPVEVLDKRCLPRPVHPNHGHDLTGGNLEVDPCKRRHPVIAMGEPFD